MDSWIFDIDSIIFTRLRHKLTRKFKEKYPSINVTDSGENIDNAKFPTVYFRVLQGVEKGQTLDRNGINAMLYTTQIDVSGTDDKVQAKEIMSEIINIMKDMYFELPSTPRFTSETGVIVCVARFRRLIGGNDNF